MSSNNWNFRQILDVYPDSYSFTCVGTTKNGARCGNKRPFLAVADLSSAAHILDKMDNLSALKSSYQYLEELADLTLCKRWHRYAQTDQVSMRWESAIRQYARDLKREREQAAALRAKQKLADMRVAAFKLKAELENENKENAPPVKAVKLEAPIPCIVLENPVLAHPSIIVPEPKLEDPFVEKRALKHARPNVFGTTLFGNSAFRNPDFSTLVAPLAVERGLLSFDAPLPSYNCSKPTSRAPLQDKTPSENIQDAAFHSDSVPPPQHSSLLSPPDTPVRSKTSEEIEFKAETSPTISPINIPSHPGKEQREITFMKTSTITVTSNTNFAYEFGSQSSNPMAAFRFELPADTLKESQSKSSLSNKNEVSPYASDCEPTPTPRPKSFEIDIPRKSSLRQRIPRLNTTMPVHNTVIEKFKPPLEITPRETSKYREGTWASSRQPMDQSQYQVSPSTPVITISSTSPSRNKSIPLTFSEHPSTQPLTPVQQQEEFGYAVVTPSSTRYSTYLPARQQYGLSTPPETPEKLLPPGPTPKKPPRDEDFFTSLPSPVPFTIPRKPLPSRPSPSLKRRDEVRWKSSERARVCHVCRAPRYTDGDGCGCVADKEDEEENVKSGCLDSLGWARLREKVIQRTKSKVIKATHSDAAALGEKERHR